jgi:hypothetical protein
MARRIVGTNLRRLTGLLLNRHRRLQQHSPSPVQRRSADQAAWRKAAPLTEMSMISPDTWAVVPCLTTPTSPSHRYPLLGGLVQHLVALVGRRALEFLHLTMSTPALSAVQLLTAIGTLVHLAVALFPDRDLRPAGVDRFPEGLGRALGCLKGKHSHGLSLSD